MYRYAIQGMGKFETDILKGGELLCRPAASRHLYFYTKEGGELQNFNL
jgi:hypothetical protein